LSIHQKPVEKIQVSLKSDKKTLHEDQYTFSIICHSIILRMRNVSDKVVEKIKTHVLCSLTLFQNRAVYEITWKNIVELDRPQITIRCMQIAWLVTKTIDAHRHTHNLCYLLLLHCNCGCTNTPQCHVILTLPVLSGLGWTFKLLLSKHTEASIWHARPFVSTYLETSICSLMMWKKKIYYALWNMPCHFLLKLFDSYWTFSCTVFMALLQYIS
jgi:hypothetical protein